MIIYPAIDLIDGECVRLIQGEKKQKTVYSKKPEDIAKTWEKLGGEYLHVVDLGGAFDGKSKNLDAVKKIVSSVNIPLQLGGGVRTLDDIKRILDVGVSRVIIGTAAVENPTLVEDAIKNVGEEKIVIGIDARKGKVALRGWTNESEVGPVELAVKMKNIGAKWFVYTDILRDGMLTGPNLSALEEFSVAVGGGVIASGGISSIKDIENVNMLSDKGIVGIITGKALYENRIKLDDAIRAVL